MKKILIFVMIIACSFGLLSCGNSHQSFNRINSPRGLKCEEKVVSWEPVGKADYYLVSINDVIHKVKEKTEYTLDFSSYEGEILQIKVLAGNESPNIADSVFSDSIIVEVPGGMSQDEVRNELSSNHSIDSIDKIMNIAKANNVSNKNIAPLVDIFYMYINGQGGNVNYLNITSSGTQAIGFLMDYLNEVYSPEVFTSFFNTYRQAMLKVLSSLYAFDVFKESETYKEINERLKYFPMVQSSSKIVLGTRNDILSMVERYYLNENDMENYIKAYSNLVNNYGYRFSIDADEALVKTKVVEYSLYSLNQALTKYNIFCTQLSDKIAKDFCKRESLADLIKYYTDVIFSKQYRNLQNEICCLEYEYLEYIIDDSVGLSTQINNIISQEGKVRVDFKAFALDYKKAISYDEYLEMCNLQNRFTKLVFSNETVMNNKIVSITDNGNIKIGRTPDRFDFNDDETIEYFQNVYQVRGEIYSSLEKSDFQIYFTYTAKVYKILAKNLINAGLHHTNFEEIRNYLTFVGNRLEEYMDETIDFCFEVFALFDVLKADLEEFKGSMYRQKYIDIIDGIQSKHKYNGADGDEVMKFIMRFDKDSLYISYLRNHAQAAYTRLFY